MLFGSSATLGTTPRLLRFLRVACVDEVEESCPSSAKTWFEGEDGISVVEFGFGFEEFVFAVDVA